MNLEQAALYQRLQEFSFDQPDAHLSFSQRLARDNHWSLAYANRVIEEYKKFAFLAVAAEHPVTPSDQVDQAWHLHLLYTRSYWDVFCPQVLQVPLHHGPTQGGKPEQRKFTDWYEQTLTSYGQFFGTPPVDIWSPSHIRFGRDIHFARINTQQNWIVPKIVPEFKFPDLGNGWMWHRNLLILPLLLNVFLAIAGCEIQNIQPINSLTINPYAESLSAFAISYLWIGSLGLIGVIAIAGVGKLINRNLQLAPPLLTLLALVLFGLTLLKVGADIAKPTGLAFIGFYLLACFSGALFRACALFWKPYVFASRSKTLLEPYPPSWEEFIASTSWTNTQSEVWNELIRMVSLLGMTSLCGLGIARIFIGLSRERPVGYLVVVCMILGFYTLKAIGQQPGVDHRASVASTEICKILVCLSLIITVPGSIYFLFIRLGGNLIWIAFLGLFLVGMFSDQTTYRSSRGTWSSGGSSFGGGSGCGSDGDSGDSGCGDSGCGGCGGCGD